MDDLAIADLRLFVRIAALGSLSAVARERGAPVSQVSRALTRIEKSCRARLIHRSTHGLTLTAEGETFLACAQRIGGSFDELEGEFATQAGAASGRVRVAASTVIAEHLLAPSLATLYERHPGVRVDLEVSDQLADLVREGIDIAIRTTDELPPTQVARRIGTLGRALYAAPAYAQREGLPAHPDELCNHRLVTNSAVSHLNQWAFVVDGRSLQLTLDGHWRANDTGMVARLVLQGLGIGRLATLVGDPLVRSGHLVRVLPDFAAAQTVPIHAVTASARQRLPKIRACIEHWAAWFDAALKT